MGWSVFENLYKENWLSVSVFDRKPKIPKLLHLVWVGSPFPDKYNELLDSWRWFHKDWTIKIWTDADILTFPFENRAIFNEVRNIGTKSDILRYEILYQYGGVYIDVDFLCLRSFNDFLYLDFFGGHAGSEFPEILNGLFGCTPKHQILRNVIDGLKNKPLPNEATFEEILSFCGTYYLAKIFQETENKGRCVVFPKEFFYSFPGSERFTIRNNPDWKEMVLKHRHSNSYCLHLWACSWQK